MVDDTINTAIPEYIPDFLRDRARGFARSKFRDIYRHIPDFELFGQSDDDLTDSEVSTDKYRYVNPRNVAAKRRRYMHDQRTMRYFDKSSWSDGNLPFYAQVFSNPRRYAYDNIVYDYWYSRGISPFSKYYKRRHKYGAKKYLGRKPRPSRYNRSKRYYN